VIVAKSHFQLLFKIFDSKCIGVTSLTSQSHVHSFFTVGHFLLVVLWNQDSISNGLRD